ncbi:MAG: hypothetical protein FD177_1016 [Desulfovibrionaceae bacterium]|nr:MAG: hypothetical protein FD177_1016 [Desulfovibrionaceae bacterium]
MNSYGKGFTQCIEYTATAMVLVGVWFIGSQNILGQWLMLAAQVCWMVVSISRDVMALTIQSVVLAILTVRAIIEWGAR